MAYTTTQISEKLGEASAIIDRIKLMRSMRIALACRKAGLGSMGCQLHNCFVGQPWREVDYHWARYARRLCATQFEANHIRERYYRRMMSDWREAGCP